MRRDPCKRRDLVADMNNHRRIEKARDLIRPVKVSVAQRAPAHMSKAEADHVLLCVASAEDSLARALTCYVQAARRSA